MNPLHGFRGHPSHPPMTDAAIGAYTVAALALLAALFGFEESVMARTGLVALVVGLGASAASIVTGLADYAQISKGTPLRRAAAIHGSVMAVASVLFLAAVVLLWPAYDTGDASTPAIITALAGYAVLSLGGWMGGSVVFVYGMRVLNEPETPPAEAFRPKP